jgi:hypothetical protein
LSSLYVYFFNSLLFVFLSFFLSLLYVEERCCRHILFFVFISCFALISSLFFIISLLFSNFNSLHHMCLIDSLLLCFSLFPFSNLFSFHVVFRNLFLP